ncbi:MAG: hypothetical protein ACLP1X_18355 [Polyangiaceae bacterium]
MRQRGLAALVGGPAHEADPFAARRHVKLPAIVEGSACSVARATLSHCVRRGDAQVWATGIGALRLATVSMSNLLRIPV